MLPILISCTQFMSRICPFPRSFIASCNIFLMTFTDYARLRMVIGDSMSDECCPDFDGENLFPIFGSVKTTTDVWVGPYGAL